MHNIQNSRNGQPVKTLIFFLLVILVYIVKVSSILICYRPARKKKEENYFDFVKDELNRDLDFLETRKKSSNKHLKIYKSLKIKTRISETISVKPNTQTNSK